MNYEIESKLREKVDRWEFHALKSENDSLKNDLHSMRRELDELKSAHRNRHDAIERLIDTLAHDLSLAEISNELHEIKQYL
jgi:predicted component of type VI protein secretion system